MGNTKKQKHAPLRKKNNRFEKKKLFDNKKQNSVDIKQNQTPLRKKTFSSLEQKPLKKKKNLQNIEKPSLPQKKKTSHAENRIVGGTLNKKPLKRKTI